MPAMALWETAAIAKYSQVIMPTAKVNGVSLYNLEAPAAFNAAVRRFLRS